MSVSQNRLYCLSERFPRPSTFDKTISIYDPSTPNPSLPFVANRKSLGRFKNLRFRWCLYDAFSDSSPTSSERKLHRKHWASASFWTSILFYDSFPVVLARATLRSCPRRDIRTINRSSLWTEFFLWCRIDSMSSWCRLDWFNTEFRSFIQVQMFQKIEKTQAILDQSNAKSSQSAAEYREMPKFHSRNDDGNNASRSSFMGLLLIYRSSGGINLCFFTAMLLLVQFALVLFPTMTMDEQYLSSFYSTAKRTTNINSTAVGGGRTASNHSERVCGGKTWVILVQVEHLSQSAASAWLNNVGWKRRTLLWNVGNDPEREGKTLGKSLQVTEITLKRNQNICSYNSTYFQFYYLAYEQSSN